MALTGCHMALSAYDGLLLVLQVLGQLRPGPVVPDQVRVLSVTVQDLQHLWRPGPLHRLYQVWSQECS